MLSIDIPRWVNWIAQDKSGAWWGYSVEPLRNDHGWYENEVGEYLAVGGDRTTELGRLAEQSEKWKDDITLITRG